MDVIYPEFAEVLTRNFVATHKFGLYAGICPCLENRNAVENFISSQPTIWKPHGRKEDA